MKSNFNEWPFGAIFVCGNYIINKSEVFANTFWLTFLRLINYFSINLLLYTLQKTDASKCF